MELKNKVITVIAVAVGIIILAMAVHPGENPENSTIMVSSAASLTEAFGDIVSQFEAENPGIKVDTNFAGSGTLRMQIEGGAPIDVFASASQKDMNILGSKGLIDNNSRKNFASNTMVLIVPSNSTLNITGVEDLTKPEVKRVAIGDPKTAPVGNYTKEALEEAGVQSQVENKTLLSENVKQVLVYVERNEADAGFVYMTDAKTAQPGSIKIIGTVPVSTPINYPISVLSSSKHKEEAQKFVDFVTGEKGKAILESYGFTTRSE